MCGGEGVCGGIIESSMGGRWKEREKKRGCVGHRHADKFTSHRRLPCSHVHCSSVVNKILSPATVLKLCPPGVTIVISSGVVMEKGGRCN